MSTFDFIQTGDISMRQISFNVQPGTILIELAQDESGTDYDAWVTADIPLAFVQDVFAQAAETLSDNGYSPDQWDEPSEADYESEDY